jgi:hypothetical protein
MLYLVYGKAKQVVEAYGMNYQGSFDGSTHTPIYNPDVDESHNLRSCRIHYVDDNKVFCALKLEFFANQPNRWFLSLVRHNSNNPGERDVYLLSSLAPAAVEQASHAQNQYELIHEKKAAQIFHKQLRSYLIQVFLSLALSLENESIDQKCLIFNQISQSIGTFQIGNPLLDAIVQFTKHPTPSLRISNSYVLSRDDFIFLIKFHLWQLQENDRVSIRKLTVDPRFLPAFITLALMPEYDQLLHDLLSYRELEPLDVINVLDLMVKEPKIGMVLNRCFQSGYLVSDVMAIALHKHGQEAINFLTEPNLFPDEALTLFTSDSLEGARFRRAIFEVEAGCHTIREYLQTAAPNSDKLTQYRQAEREYKQRLYQAVYDFLSGTEPNSNFATKISEAGGPMKAILNEDRTIWLRRFMEVLANTLLVVTGFHFNRKHQEETGDFWFFSRPKSCTYLMRTHKTVEAIVTSPIAQIG